MALLDQCDSQGNHSGRSRIGWQIRLQGAGEADAPGEADASEVGNVLELVPVPGGASSESGAVVVSGASEAGGGSELSPSDVGNGASLFAAPGFADPLPAVRAPCVSPFFLLACCIGSAG